MSSENDGSGSELVSNQGTYSGISPECDAFVESSRQDCVDSRLQSLEFELKFVFGTTVAAIEHIACLCRNYKGKVVLFAEGKSYDPIYPGKILDDPAFMSTKHIRGVVSFDPMEDYNYPDPSAENAAKTLKNMIVYILNSNPREPTFQEKLRRGL